MTEQLIILIEIILIDLVLAGDNAIIIGMVASKFPAENRKKIIFWGISGAVILRIILTLFTAYLLQINGLRFIGGILLLYVVYKLYRDVIDEKNNAPKFQAKKLSFYNAIWTILLADFTMSLDNVLGVAGAAGNHYHLLIFGLIRLDLSSIIVGFSIASIGLSCNSTMRLPMSKAPPPTAIHPVQLVIPRPSAKTVAQTGSRA